MKGIGATIGTILAKIGADVQVAEENPRELSLQPLTLACAWHVRYTEKYPMQGFYRLWVRGSEEDEPPRGLLGDIRRLANRG